MDLLKTRAIDLTALQFVKLRDLVHQHAGLFFEENKQYFVQKRLERRMELLGIKVVDEYLKRLETDLGRTEVHCLIEELTVNETYFFRNLPQLEGFSKHVLPSLIESKRKQGDLTIRMWSAACSTGEEPYTLAILLHEALPDIKQWSVEIMATDIDRQALRAAHRATYGRRSVRDVPPALIAKYFAESSGSYQLVPEITSLVRFHQVNLIDKLEMRKVRGIDSIFCRNVLIYFDDSSRRLALGFFYDALNPGGYIFLGHAESVGRITAAFRIVRLNDFLCYAK